MKKDLLLLATKGTSLNVLLEQVGFMFGKLKEE
jgi:hypothetical protein